MYISHCMSECNPCHHHTITEGSLELYKRVGMETIPVGDVFCVPSGQTPCYSDHTHQQN